MNEKTSAMPAAGAAMKAMRALAPAHRQKIAAGMAATAKHFPTHAGVRSDSHTEIAEDRRAFADLLDDLAPYRSLIAAGVQSIMVAHVIFPQLDPLPASLSRWWISSQLRSELGFNGAIVSDDVSMAGASVAGNHADRAVRALEAGCDLVLVCNAPEAIPSVLEAAAPYASPPAQLRLMRLRGRQRIEWRALHESSEWRTAVEILEPLCERPGLELKG